MKKPFKYRKYQGGWIGATIGAVGGLIGGGMSMHGQSSANSMSNKMALRQMIFQRDMANTAHRREVRDLRLAGLNPILSGTGGAGAASPAGAKSEYSNEAGAGVASAMDALSKVTQALVDNQQAKRVEAETALTKARTATEIEQPELVRSQTDLTHQNVSTAQALERNYRADTLLKKVGAHVQMTEIDKNKELTRLFEKQGLTQDQQTRLLTVNVLQADQILKSLTKQGAYDASDFAKWKQYVDGTLETIGKVPGINLLTKTRKKN